MSRYSICLEAVMANLEYAKKKNINFSATLFDDSILFYTNIKISDATKKNIADNFGHTYQIFDEQSYDAMMTKIRATHPNGGTDFMMTFKFISMIPEISKGDIFFLSDGQNKHHLEKEHLDFLKQFKDRTTTMGIGYKGAYDERTLSQMSNTSETIEGNSSELIQQELMAKMADVTTESDIWRDIKIEFMAPLSSMNMGSLMNVSKITKEEYDAATYTTSKHSPNLVLENYNGYLLIKKNNNVTTIEPAVEKVIDMVNFVIDRSGSMADIVGGGGYSHGLGMPHGLAYNPYMGSPSPLAPAPPYYGGGAALGPSSGAYMYPGAPPSPHYMPASPTHGGLAAAAGSGGHANFDASTNDNQFALGAAAAGGGAAGGGAASAHNHGPEFMLDEESPDSETEEEVYVKYELKADSFKSYQRFILKFMNMNFKGQITYTDSDGNVQTHVLHDPANFTDIAKTDENANTFDVIKIACDMGAMMNSAYLIENKEKIGLFRALNKMIKTHNAFFDKMLASPIDDMILMEMLFYNKKHGTRLYFSTLTPGQANMGALMATSSSTAYRAQSAAATMSVGIGPTPSCSQPHTDEEYKPVNRDMSMCTVCYSEVRQYIFSCGHCYACEGCAEKLLMCTPKNKCSYCKQDVTSIRKLKMTDDQKNPEHFYKCITPECYNIAEIVSKCSPIDEEDQGYHLTYCKKCYRHVMKEAKKQKKAFLCFCGKEITKIKQNIYFN